MTTAISHYTPDLPHGAWDEIAEFVRAAVRDCDQQTPYAARTLLIASSWFVHWCADTAGLDLERAVIFQRQTIGEYIARGCPQMSPASAGNRRSQLLRMSELLLPPQDRTVRLVPMPASDPIKPYPGTDVVALRSWADGQNTTYKCVNANVLLALGCGAGLSAAEVGDVQVQHVHVDADGVLIEVVGKRPRWVPVLAAWEPALIAIKQSAIRPDLYVFRPRREVNHRNLVGNFVDKTDVTRVRPNLQRMRATWIVTHLGAGSPVKALVQAAGVDSLEALTRYLQYVPAAQIEDFRRAFREAQFPGQFEIDWYTPTL